MAVESPQNTIVENSDRIELFVKLLGAHQQQVHRYVLCLVPNAHDADDILQETNLFLWREFHQFEEGTNFVAWACTVAFHKVNAWRKQKSRLRLVYSDAFLTAVSSELIAGEERQEERASALNKCIERLTQQHRDLLQLRYGASQNIEDIASRQGRSVDAVYRMLSRVRHALYECVGRSLSPESAS
jgi:RNA polymerase sigma-70 factor, ECF subfamily